MPPRTLALVDPHDDSEHQVEVLDDGRVRVADRIYSVHAGADGRIGIEADRRLTGWTTKSGDMLWVFIDGRVYELAERSGNVQRGASGATRRRSRDHGSQTAPMPATVRRVLVAPGDRVNAGDSLLILEAMKMELPIRATAAGIVQRVNCTEGELVQPGVALLEIHEGEAPAGQPQS